MEYNYEKMWPSHYPRKPKVSPPKAIRGTSIRILGCGTSTGVPLLACKCEVCLSKDSKNKRLRASVVFQAGSKVFLVDTSPDLREQAYRNGIEWIDAVLYTHPHADHLHGIDDLRSFNFIMARPLELYGNQWSIDTIQNKFDYIFKATQEGGGKPQLSLNLIEKPFKIQGVKIIPLPLLHGKMPVLGYRINNIAYITDCSYIPEKTLKLLRNLDLLVLDCLRFETHPTHFNVEAALAMAKQIKAKRTFFTHMGHEIEYHSFSKLLPKGMHLAYDGLLLKA